MLSEIAGLVLGRGEDDACPDPDESLRSDCSLGTASPVDKIWAYDSLVVDCCTDLGISIGSWTAAAGTSSGTGGMICTGSGS